MGYLTMMPKFLHWIILNFWIHPTTLLIEEL
jgi:hypothetical protein